MATIASARPGMTRDERFFFVTALWMAGLIVVGFSFNLAMGRSSFAVAPIFHVHAAIFFGWVVLYLLQSGLIAAGSVALHRRLGWLAAIMVPAMMIAGTMITLHSVRSHGGPPFIATNEFLFGNPMGLIYFGGMVLAAILARRNTGWHRRLMFCAMASLTGPAFGRLLPMPFLIPWAWWLAAFVFPAIFPLIGMWRDKRRTGRVHRAWYWGLGALFAAILVGDLIAYSPLGHSITQAVVAGTPGDDGDFSAHFP